MRTFVCQKCGYKTEKESRTCAVICPCGCYMLEISTPPANEEMKSPTIIFKDGGVGWAGKKR